jgi:OFA family oxalate/formate antiporter-like MFS transporter
MSEKAKNRWLVVVGALLIQMSLGAIYIYSVFKPALKEQFPDWSATNLALPSQLVLAMFALGVIVFGRIQDKIGPRKIATLGGILLGAGLVVAKFATSLPVFVLGFSVIGGIGIGAAYVCPIATCVKWFPDKRGLITGLAVAGFGAGGLVFTPVAKTLIASQGIMNTFLFLGLIFLVLVVAGAQFMVNPPAGYKPAGWNPPAPQPGVAAAAHVDYTWQQMLGTPQFWMLWLTYFAGCAAGLMIIMNTTNVWQSFSLLGMNVGDVPVAKAAYATLISQGATAVIVVSIFNAIGRIAWGKVSDNIGRRPTLLLMFGIAGVAMLVLNLLRVYPAYMAGVAVVGFCFGGFLALYPAVTADYFGTKNVGANYGWVFSAYGAGGLFGPWLAPKLMEVVQKISYETADKTGQIVIKTYDAGNYLNAFVISGVLCFVALGILAAVKPPKKA